MSRDAFSKQAMLALYRNVLKLHRRVLPQVVDGILAQSACLSVL